MFPGMDKRAMEAAMRKLGVQQQPIDAKEVVIKLKGSDSEIVIANPSVTKVSMMGQETFQVAGEQSERKTLQSQQQLFSDDDVKTVVDQTGASEAEAKAALAKVNGDLAAAILLFGEKRG
ncbi:Nascent polypeptide-associated complex protein [Candidatus Woesearchaeota archaeon]|nr:Nascent polypeptide-associated complex protein [Candidatus Woesearchaeota archaeon]